MPASPSPIVATVTSYQPATFLERGAALPFTTPQLAGTRVRTGERDRLELIVPNPSGARGVYIVPWDGVDHFCRPTLHDRQLNARLQAERAVTPAAIRRVAIEVAAEGLAGPAVAAAAAQAREADAGDRLLTNFGLLMLLVTQSGLPADRGGELEIRAKRAVAAVAPRLGRSPEAVAAMLEELSDLFTPLGVASAPAAGSTARLPATIVDLVRLAGSVRAWLAGPPARSLAEAELVAGAAELTTVWARAVLADAQALLADMPALLQRWGQAREEVVALVSRPSWLLDGWDRIVLLWRETAAGSGAALSEMADLVPGTPREVAGWARSGMEMGAGALRHRRQVAPPDDWRAGRTVQDLVARNEQRFAALLTGPARLAA